MGATSTVLQPLPIDAALPAILAAVRDHGAVVVQAEPGAGKTTRVPTALLDAQLFAGEAWVVQPRRMAAVLSARRVADERGERCGDVIGYSVRFDEQIGPKTRVRYVTDGLLLRRLLADPLLHGIGLVVFDEFHEQRVAMDLGLAVARLVRAGQRPDLRVVVMSATLQANELGQWLGAPVVVAPGRVFPVEITHAATLDHRPMPDQVAGAVRELAQQRLDGDILVFLPGASEIRRCAEVLATRGPPGWVVRPLHGSLPLREQELAIAVEAAPKVILATNIAETSLTLPNVVAVVDSGVARIAGYAAWSGLSTLQVQPISKASATQRAGRAGRVRPGKCLRLYTAFDHDNRQPFDKPEILRADLAEPLLLVAALRKRLALGDLSDFLLAVPPEPAVQAATILLQRLGALDKNQVDKYSVLTAVGEAMLRWPLSPRLARMMVAAEALGIGITAAQVAALLSEGEVRSRGDNSAFRAPHGQSDVLALLEDLDAVAKGARPRDRQLDPMAAATARRSADQLTRLLRLPDGKDVDVPSALGMAILAGFGDRLAQRRQANGNQFDLPGGVAVQLGPECQTTQPRLVVILDADERKDGKTRATWVRMAHGVDIEQVFEAMPDRITFVSTLQLEGKRAVRIARTLCDGIELECATHKVQSGPDVAALLAAAVRERGLATVVDVEALQALQLRVAFARQFANLEALPLLDDHAIDAALVQAAETATHVDQVAQADVLQLLRTALALSYAGAGLSRLDRAAPESMHLPGGRKLRIHYEADRPPWTSSRMQDFFGLADGPRVANGTVAVVLHLLAPNQRPVQVTTDLAGFWDRHYPALRRELSRHYPRHYWPDDPLTAEPPPPRPPRPPRK